MFGFGKKKEEPVTLVKRTEVNNYTNEFPIRYIFLTDVQNYKINGTTGYNAHGAVIDKVTNQKKYLDWVSDDTWANHGEKVVVSLYFVFEITHSGQIAFEHDSFTYENEWVYGDKLSKVRFSDGDSIIKYRFIEYEKLYSDGSKHNETERIVEEIILNRNNAPFQQGNVRL